MNQLVHLIDALIDFLGCSADATVPMDCAVTLQML